MTDWAHILNDRLRADVTAKMRDRWNEAMQADFPGIDEPEKSAAALRVAEHLATHSGKYQRKVTLTDMIEQLRFTRNRQEQDGGHRETLEEACARIARVDCPHLRWSMIAAPQRRHIVEELMQALRISRVEYNRNIAQHPRHGMRPADPWKREQLARLRAETPPERMDADEYLFAVERILQGAAMEPAPVPMVDLGGWRQEQPRRDHAAARAEAEGGEW